MMSNILTNSKTIYGDLAELLDYPAIDYLERVRILADDLAVKHPEASSHLLNFAEALSGARTEEQEEIYNRTFDIAPICNPYLSSYFFGEESFERGNLMANLDGAYKKCRFEFTGELPDHLRVVLRFLSRLNFEESSDLVNYVMSKPVREMIDRLAISNNPFTNLLRAINSVLETDFPKEEMHG